MGLLSSVRRSDKNKKSVVIKTPDGSKNPQRDGSTHSHSSLKRASMVLHDFLSEPTPDPNDPDLLPAPERDPDLSSRDDPYCLCCPLQGGFIILALTHFGFSAVAIIVLILTKDDNNAKDDFTDGCNFTLSEPHYKKLKQIWTTLFATPILSGLVELLASYWIQPEVVLLASFLEFLSGLLFLSLMITWLAYKVCYIWIIDLLSSAFFLWMSFGAFRAALQLRKLKEAAKEDSPAPRAGSEHLPQVPSTPYIVVDAVDSVAEVNVKQTMSKRKAVSGAENF